MDWPRPAGGEPVQSARAYRHLLPRLGDVLSLETSLVLYVFSGRFKMIPSLRIIPIDLTLLLLVVMVVFALWEVGSRRLKPPPLTVPVVAMILFSEFMVASLFWSNLNTINTDKAIHYVVLTLPSFIVGCMIGSDSQRRERFVRMLAWLSCLILLRYCWYRYVVGIDIGDVAELPVDRGELKTNTYAEFGDHAEMVFIMLICLIAFGRRTIMAAVGLGLTLFVLAATGSRGSLAFSILAILLLAAGLLLRQYPLKGSLARLSMTVGMMVIVTVIGYFAIGASPDAESGQFRTVDRFQAQVSGEDTHSMDVRHRGRDYAFRQWLESPLLGWGIGAFEIHDDDLKDPHNLPLELLMEMGLIGLMLFAVPAAVATFAAMGTLRDPWSGSADVALALMALTNVLSQLTIEGSIGNDRILFCFIGLVLGRHVAGRRATGWVCYGGDPLARYRHGVLPRGLR